MYPLYRTTGKEGIFMDLETIWENCDRIERMKNEVTE